MIAHKQDPAARWGWYTAAVARLFRLQRQEVERVSWMFVYSLLAVGAFILGRIVRDTLLLSLPRNQGLDALPWLIALSAVAVSAASYTLSRTTSERRRDQTIQIVNLALVGCLFVLCLGLLLLPSNVGFVIVQATYVYVEVMGALQVILFWTFASELFDPRAARRSFAIIGGGAVLANLLAFGIRPLLSVLPGPHHLLWVLCLMMLGCVWVVRRIGQQNLATLEETARKKKPSTRLPTPKQRQERGWLSHPHLAVLAMIVGVTFVASTLIDYQFKAIVAQTYRTPEQIGNYLGSFYGITGIFACVVQFGLANPILRRFGIRFSLLLLPLALLGGSVSLGLSLWPALLSVAFTKGSENVLRYTLYDVSQNLLYVPIVGPLRARAKGWIDGILKPAAIGLSAIGIALFGYLGISSHRLSWLVVGLICVWIVLIFRVHREYVATLVRSMQRSQLGLEGSALQLDSEASALALRSVLSQGTPQQILHAIELLPHIAEHSWSSELARLLKSPHTEVCIAALAVLPRLHDTEHDALIRPLLKHPDERVRAQAIGILCTLRKEDATYEVLSLLEDPALSVRQSAIIGLIRDGGLDGVLHAAEPFKRMLDSPDPTQRQCGAEIIAHLGVRTFYQPILRMLQDPVLSVRIKAIQAAGSLRSAHFTDTLFSMLHERYVSSHAARSLGLYGPDLIPQIQKKLADPTQTQISPLLFRILGAIPQPETLALLEQLLLKQCASQRPIVLRAISRLRQQQPNLLPNVALLRSCLRTALHDAYFWRLAQQTLHASFAQSTALHDALHERTHLAQQEIFLLLDLLFPHRQIALIHQKLLQADTRLRANALELLDNLLQSEPRTRRILLALLEGSQSIERIALESFQLKPLPLSALIPSFQEEPCLYAFLLWTLATDQDTPPTDLFLQARSSPAPLLRELAALLLSRTLPTHERDAHLAPLLQDTSSAVARYVNGLLSRTPQHEAPMLSTFEKILFLKEVDLFQRLSTEDLAQIAQIAEEIHVEKDEDVIVEGELGDALYILIEGSVSVFKEGTALTTLREKEPFGEMGVLDHAPRSATVRALEDLRLLKIEQQAFRDLMDDRMEIAHSVIQVLLNRLRKANQSSIQSPEKSTF